MSRFLDDVPLLRFCGSRAVDDSEESRGTGFHSWETFHHHDDQDDEEDGEDDDDDDEDDEDSEESINAL